MSEGNAELLEIILAKLYQGRKVDVVALEDVDILREAQRFEQPANVAHSAGHDMSRPLEREKMRLRSERERAMANFDAAAIARLDRLYAAPQVVAQRRRLREILSPRPGETGLDIGCGAGHLTCELARDVPGGHIFGIDESADAVAASKARAESEGLAKAVTLRVSDASSLPFEDQGFDFAVAVQVYCYVKQIEVALGEARRVLRDGGRLAILDSDWDACLYRSADDELTRRLLAARSKHQFAHAHLPRHLPALLRSAGFRLVSSHVIVMMETEFHPDSFGVGLLGPIRDAGRKDGVSSEILQSWESDLRARTHEGQWFFCLNRFVFIAERP